MTNDFHRTNINLLRTDVDWLIATYGYGWTEKVRDIVHGYVNGMQIHELRLNDIKGRLIHELDHE